MKTLRCLVPMTDQEIEGLFAQVGHSVRIADLAFTTQTIDDFWFARYEAWDEAGEVVRNDRGLLIVANARPRKLSALRDVVVMGFVMARAVLGVDRRESDLFSDLPEMPIVRSLLVAAGPGVQAAAR